MSEITQVKVSTNYDVFKFYSCNRPVSPVHVNRLVCDENFKKKYILSPIIVDKDYRIIDGQHRFYACKMLNIPIYYIMDKAGSEEDIKLRNSQQTPWDNRHFLQFHAEKNADYKLLQDFCEKYTMRTCILFAAYEKICGEGNRGSINRKFKDGKFSFTRNKEMFIEFINTYVPEIKKCLIFKGKQRARPYFSNTVVSGFAHHFMTSRKVFDKALKRIASTSFHFPFCASYEEARECVEKLASYKERPIDIE